MPPRPSRSGNHDGTSIQQVRPIVEHGGGRRLQKISRTAKDPIRIRRDIVVLMSAQGQTVKDITSSMQVSDDYVRDVIPRLAQGIAGAVARGEVVCVLGNFSPHRHLTVRRWVEDSDVELAFLPTCGS